MVKRVSKNSVSLAGEFAVLSQLALERYDASLTLGHTKNIDILVSDPENNSFITLEVKTKLGKSAPSKSKLFGLTFSWPMKKKHEEIRKSNLYYCFVLIDEKRRNEHRYFIVPSLIVARYVKAEHALWLKEDPNHKDTEMRSFRIGVNENGYRLSTPWQGEYENKWRFNNI